MENQQPAPAKRTRKTSLFAKPVPKEESLTTTVTETVALDAEAPIKRAPMRQPMRDEDPRVRAERRAAELMGNLGSLDRGTDNFTTPEPPPGWSYEWKMKSVLGQEDPTYQTQLAHTGWEAVPTNRHPEMMPIGEKYATIERKGMILMERPAIITEEVKRLDLRNARDQVRQKEQQLSQAPDGTMTRDHAQVKPKIKKGFEAMPIPE